VRTESKFGAHGAHDETASEDHKALANKQLLKSHREIFRDLSQARLTIFIARVVDELVDRGAWEMKLNDRFYKRSSFGTGGLRGRTIGKIVTKAERGNAGAGERPQFPASAPTRDFANVNRATQGLVAYAKGGTLKTKSMHDRKS